MALQSIWLWIKFVFCYFFDWIRFIRKAYGNLGVYGHSKLISLIWWSVYVTFLHCYRILYLSFQSFVNKKEWDDDKLSFEFRSHYCFIAMPHLYRWTLRLWLTFNHLIPDFAVILFGRYMSSYNMGVFTTIPLSANIKSTYISKIKLYSKMDRLKQSKLEQALKIAEVDDKNIKNINLLWVTGNDEIEQTYQDTSSYQDTIFYIHGGAYLFGGASHVGFISRLSLATKKRIAYVMYDTPTMNPKTCFKIQIDQLLFTYLYLVHFCKIPPQKIVVAGDSAGGGLAVLFMSNISRYIQQHDKITKSWQFPRGFVLFSPWIDISCKSGSWRRNQHYDVIARYRYAQRMSKILYSPFCTNMFSEAIIISCSILIFVSKNENLYDDSVNLVKKLKRDNMGNNIDVTLIEKANMVHAWPFAVTSFPEAKEAIDTVVRYIEKWLNQDNELMTD